MPSFGYPNYILAYDPNAPTCVIFFVLRYFLSQVECSPQHIVPTHVESRFPNRMTIVIVHTEYDIFSLLS
jgi:hypothetical protein